MKETVDQLPDFVRLAATMGIAEVHLQRLVFDEQGYGMAERRALAVSNPRRRQSTMRSRQPRRSARPWA